MSITLRCFALALFALLVVLPAQTASAEPVSSADTLKISLDSTGSDLPANLRPQSATPAEPFTTELQPVQLARVPSYSVTTPSLLAAGAQPIGFQRSPEAQRRWTWTLWGAAIGLAVGLIDDDPIENAIIGGAVGFGLSYLIRY